MNECEPPMNEPDWKLNLGAILLLIYKKKKKLRKYSIE